MLAPLERVILDHEFRNLTREDPNDRVAMIAIDQRSLDFFSKNRMYWPWPREFYQIVTDYLQSEGARLIIFDIYFDTPDFDRINVDGEASDRRFAKSMGRAGNVLLAMKTSPQMGDNVNLAEPPDSSLFPWEVKNIRKGIYQQSHKYTSLPISLFRDSAEALGNTAMLTDADAVIRRINLFDSTATGEEIPTLGMATWLALQEQMPQLKWTEKGLKAGNVHVPLLEDGSYQINWYKKGGVVEGTFPYYSFQAVVQSAIQSKRNPEAGRLIPDGTFEDKIVFVGASAAGLGDIKSTPVSSLEAFPGMEIHATVLNNLLDQQFINHISGWWNGVLLLILAFGIAFLVAYNRPLWGIIITAALLLFLVGIGAYLFAQYRFILPVGLLFTHTALTFTGVIIYKYFSEERQKKQIKTAFSQYVQPEYVHQVTENPELLKLGGQKKQLTVLFSDLAGFTTLSESMPPEKLVSFLNEYLSSMTRTIFEHGGTLDKFIGDAIMAFWGAPIAHENTAILACRSAIKMIRKLERQAPEWEKQGKPYVFARYGINTGPMIVGNMGSENRFNYTVLGDAVNLAARLEPANKEFGTTAMISEFTYKQLNSDFLCRQLDLLIVKGKTKPVTVYELMGDRTQMDDEEIREIENIIAIYQTGLNHYYRKEWNEAIAKFQEVQQIRPNDGPAATYVQRSREFIENPPEPDWDGVYRLLRK